MFSEPMIQMATHNEMLFQEVARMSSRQTSLTTIFHGAFCGDLAHYSSFEQPFKSR
jgi:hypothetical protein